MDFIPVNTPLIGEIEKEKLIECLDSGWISSEGPLVSEFEDRFSNIVDRKFGIAVSSGSAALDVAVAALEIGLGDEVILPTFSIISCSASIFRSGAKPVLVDCDLNTWNMNVDQIESKITSKTKAIMVVHTYGLPVEMDKIKNLAEKYDLFIIEDAAEMHGQYYKDKPCGSFGDISTFSFYPNKHITTGEGGMIVCNNPYLAERCRSLRNLCFQNERRFVHDELGWNYRFTSLQAALGLAQLKRLKNNIKRKREIGNRYYKNLKHNKFLLLQEPETKFSKNIYWIFGIVVKEKFQKSTKVIMENLKKAGIGSRPFFWPVHKQPVFNKKGLYLAENYTNSEFIAERGFYVPSGLTLTNSQVDYISEVIIKIFS